jgi:hypothetical protein
VQNGGDVTISLSAAKYSTGVREQRTSYGVYRGDYATWTVPQADLLGADITPKARDTIITEDGVEYTVLDAPATAFLDFVRLATVELDIVNELHDTATIEVPTITQGTTGARLPIWTAKYTDIACRVQPMQTMDFGARGKDATATRYTFVCSTPINPRNDKGDWGRIIVAGKILEITGYSAAERIDELNVVECIDNP